MDRGLFRWGPRPAGSGANRILLPKSRSLGPSSGEGIPGRRMPVREVPCQGLPSSAKRPSTGTSTGSAEPMGKSPPRCRSRFGRDWLCPSDRFFSRAGVGSPWGRNAVSVTPVLPTTSSKTGASRTWTSRFARRFCRFRRVRSWLRLHSIPTGSGAWTRKRDDAGVRVGGPVDRTRWWWSLGLRFTLPSLPSGEGTVSRLVRGKTIRRLVVMAALGLGGCASIEETALPQPVSPPPIAPPAVPAPSGLRAGFGTRDITPPPGVGMSCLLSRQPAGGGLSATAVRAGHRLWRMTRGSAWRWSLPISGMVSIRPSSPR